jgi:hypothetical protein
MGETTTQTRRNLAMRTRTEMETQVETMTKTKMKMQRVRKSTKNEDLPWARAWSDARKERVSRDHRLFGARGP